MLLDCTLFSDLLTWVHKAKQDSASATRPRCSGLCCAVERQRPELTQNHRGRLQADTVAVIDRE
jgi:hypothetical protein